MSKVYLVHESGKKYGPFDYNNVDVKVSYGFCCFLLHQNGLAALGFRIEEVEEPITIDRESFMRIMLHGFNIESKERWYFAAWEELKRLNK